jgi:glycosyltransferase involved in cell wall biosynthesis
MTAWNEAPLIGPAIESLFAVGCDRVIMVDGQWQGFAPDEPDASTDGTQEIARLAGAEVIDPPIGGWASQVEARNAYMIGEPGDWYLVCDADERCHGTLPPLNDDNDTYWVELKGPVASGPISGTRLFRHAGETARYYGRHYAIYVDGLLLAKPVFRAYGFYIENIERNDPQRAAIKKAFYPHQRDSEGQQKVMRQLPAVHLGPLEYIGKGWVPGIPARNLTANEADRHYFALVENMAGPRPMYRPIEPVQDEQQQQSEPEDKPAEPTQKRQRRKEKQDG